MNRDQVHTIVPSVAIGAAASALIDLACVTPSTPNLNKP